MSLKDILTKPLTSEAQGRENGNVQATSPYANSDVPRGFTAGFGAGAKDVGGVLGYNVGSKLTQRVADALIKPLGQTSSPVESNSGESNESSNTRKGETVKNVVHGSVKIVSAIAGVITQSRRKNNGEKTIYSVYKPRELSDGITKAGVPEHTEDIIDGEFRVIE
jgi:hypothetical protein